MQTHLLFFTMNNRVSRGHNTELHKNPSHLDVRKCSSEVAKQCLDIRKWSSEEWNKMPSSIVESISMNIFKGHLDGYFKDGRGFI